MLKRKQFYKSSEWKKLSEAYAKSVNYLCERCIKKGIYKCGHIVHHKIYLTDDNYTDPNISLNWDNLEYLCMDCHNNEHMSKHDNIIWDDNGNIIKVERKELIK